MFERLPVVIPKIHPVVYAFQEFSGKGDYRIDYVPAPRITEADRTNDQNSFIEKHGCPPESIKPGVLDGRADKKFPSAVRKPILSREISPVVFLPFPSAVRFHSRPPRRTPSTPPQARSCRDAQDGAGLVHRRDRRLLRHRRRVAAVPPRRLELVRRHPLRRLLLLAAPLRHRGRRPLRQRHRLRHFQLGHQGRAGAPGELPERHQQLPLREGAHVLRPLPRHRHLLRLHRLRALPPRHGAHAAEVRHLLHARVRAHHCLALRAQGASQPARPHDLQGEAPIFSGIYWMHGWYDLCFYGASQLFPLCDLLSPSGSGPCILHYILLSWRI